MKGDVYKRQECGSFNKAAEKLYISPPAVIKQINLLESDLSLRLFIRTHRGLDVYKRQRENIAFINSRGPGDFDTYAIHQIEPITMLMGAEATRVMAVGAGMHQTVVIAFKGGRSAAVSYTHLPLRCRRPLSPKGSGRRTR